MIDIEKCEKIIIPQGAIYLGPSRKEYSEGYLELKPKTSLQLHNRPAIETLTQIKNTCSLVLYNSENEGIITLHEKSTFQMEQLTWHIHVNPFDKTSLTHWYFEGDIRKIIENIRQ